MSASDFVRSWPLKARKAKLSVWIIALFAVALVLPWFVYAWLTFSARAVELQRAEQLLGALARAYAEHAATAMGDSTPRSGEEMAAFRRALSLPGVSFSLRPIGSPALKTDQTDAVVAVEVERPDAGFAVRATMNEDSALQIWWGNARVGVVTLILRTLVVAVVGLLLVRQLRWREKAQAELASAREKAESSSRAKSEFLANMSHELRTPLNAIIGFSEIIRIGMHGPLNARYREYGADIATSGTHLLHLINEILDLSKLEAGQFDLHEGEVDLASVIRACLHLVEAQAGKSKIKLSSSNESGLPMIRADERRMRQILINLLSNAIKFTPEGGCVGITVSCGTSGFFIEVRDTGIGMSADGIAKAMEPFGQIESAISRKHDGTGLGLPIAKRLVELHGGTLTIASKVDAGTAVTIRLPSERIAQRPARLAIVQATA